MIMQELKKGQPSPEQGSQLSEEQEVDADLATAMGIRVMADPKTQEGLGQLVGAAEPSMALGQFIAQLVLNIKEQSEKAGMPIDDMVWMADGGVVDRLIDQARIDVEDFGVSIPAGGEDVINEEVMNVLKLASKSGSAPQEAPQGAGGPPLLQGPPGGASPIGRETGGMI